MYIIILCTFLKSIFSLERLKNYSILEGIHRSSKDFFTVDIVCILIFLIFIENSGQFFIVSHYAVIDEVLLWDENTASFLINKK